MFFNNIFKSSLFFLLIVIGNQFTMAQGGWCGSADYLFAEGGTSCISASSGTTSSLDNSTDESFCTAGDESDQGYWRLSGFTVGTTYIVEADSDEDIVLGVYSTDDNFSCSGFANMTCEDGVTNPETYEFTPAANKRYWISVHTYDGGSVDDYTVCFYEKPGGGSGGGGSGGGSGELTCGDDFYDTGGAGGAYSANEDVTTVICPDVVGSLIEVNFTMLDMESTDFTDYDYINVYDGNNSSSALLLKLTENQATPLTLSPTVANASGCLTFEFTSDGSSQGAGWEANVTCQNPCTSFDIEFDTGVMTNDPNQNFEIFACKAGEPVNSSVRFSVKSENDEGKDDNLITWTWDFGDGNTATGKTVDHSFADQGVYSISVIGVDENDCRSRNILEADVKISSPIVFNGTNLTNNDPTCVDDVFSLQGQAAAKVVKVEPPLPVVETTYLPDGAGVCYEPTIDYTGLFQDNSTLTDVTDLIMVFANMEHSYAGDLEISIQCPSGERVWLHNEDRTFGGGAGSPGNSGFNFGLVESSNDPIPGTGLLYEWVTSDAGLETIFEAGQNLDSDQNVPAGQYSSEQDLSGLVGCQLNGEWKLIICDLYEQDNGYVFEFGLEFDPSIYLSNEEFLPTVESLVWTDDQNPTTVVDANSAVTNASIPAVTTVNYTLTATDNAGCISDTTLSVTTISCGEPCVPPTLFSGVTSRCDDGGGTSIFDLTSTEADINPFDQSLPFNWYEDADFQNEVTGDLSNYSSGLTTLYAVVGEPGCTSVATLQLQLGAVSLEDQIVQKCATEGSNTAFFDLTLIENDMIENAEDFVFNWFEDNLLSIAITANIDNYESAGNEVIYASVEDAQGCTSVGVVTLEVGEVEANSTTIELCAGIDGTIDVNLSDYRDSINSSSIYTVTWYTNAGLTSEVADITNVTINDGDVFYALVDDGDGCSNSGQATFDLVTPPSVFNGVYELCDGGSGSANFDLLSVEIDIAPFDYGNVNFQWCEDEDCFSEINDPGNYSSNGTTVYAHVGNGCNSVAQLDLQLGLLEASNTSITKCDKGDGTADFNLSSSDSIINADNNATVSWFTDAGLSSAVADPTNYNSGTSTVYAEVNNGSCSTSVAVTLEIGTPVAISTEIQGCGSGSAIFDLTSAELAVTDGGANEVTWFSDQGLTNEINNPASYSSAEGTVYAVVGDDDCNATASVTLTIDANPTANNVTINMEEEIDGQGVANFDIGAYTTDINGGTGGVVFYADGGVVGLVEVSADGGYSSTSTTLYAVVTSSNGCKDTAFVSLLVEGYEDTSGVIIDNGDDDSLIVVETPDTVVTPDGDTVIINPGDSVIVIGTEDTIITADGDTVIVSPGDTVLVEDGDTTVLSGGDDDLPTLSSPGNGSITLCGDGEGYATFNLSSIAGQIRGNSSAGIAWFLDESTTLSISNPTAYSTQSTRVYATVTGMEGVGYADLFVVSAGNVGVSAELSRCPKEDGGASAVFDLTSAEDAITQGSNLSIQWFEDEQGTAAISSPSNFESITTTVFAELTAAGGCSGMVAVYLVVEELVGVNSTMNTCDNGDSTGTFNLTMAEVNIGGGVGYEVTWYSDADRSIEITDPTSYTTAATTVYASIQVEGESSCSANAELTLSIGEIQVKHGTLRSCISTGIASFNLREVELFMSYGISYNVTWYTNVEMTDVIGSPTDYQSNIGRVYAKFYMNGADDECFGQGHVDLYIDNFQPQDTSFTFCGDNAIGLYYNLGKYENILTSNSYLDVTWHKRPNRLDPIENPSYYLPASYENGVHTIYAEVCENMAEVQLIVFERDSFSIATDANDIVIEAGDQVELGTSAGGSFDHIWSPSNTLDDSTSANPVASPSTTTQYAVVISNDAGCEANDTVTVFVENPDDPLDEMIAKIFSPDGNGDNDELFVNGPGICEVYLRIYNRWGVLVFENTNLEIGWNGGMDNDISKPAPADDYRYALRVKRCNAEDWMEEETGVITIIR